ncbi:MAG: hypothetical protein Q9163_002518 [Psora crenata]
MAAASEHPLKTQDARQNTLGIFEAEREPKPQQEPGTEQEPELRLENIKRQKAAVEVEPEEHQPVRQEQEEGEPPFSIFSAREKRFIVIVASIAALFSPLSANIYYPALNTLAKDLHVSLSKINLTITTYLIFQGLAPAFIGSLSDETGRRPSYIICFVIYAGANIGLAKLDSYVALLVLRMLQSSGSSGTVALANAVVSDIVTSAERGTSMGYASMGATLGPTFGPIIGGLLSQFFGWRAIFWFLTVFSCTVLLIIVVSLPETCRKTVGNGSIPTRSWNMPVLSYIHLKRRGKAGKGSEQKSKSSSKRRPNPLRSIYILIQKESSVIIIYGGTLFAGLYMVLSSMPSQFADNYGFNTLQVGLCYIPSGLGSMTASYIIGRLLNWNFRRHAGRVGMEISDKKQQDLRRFPIEAARLQVILPLVYTAAATVVSFGWVMQSHTSLAGPIVLLYISTFCMMGSFQGLSILVVDLNRGSPGAATAAMNLARCWMGAGAVAFVVPLLNAVGIGWTYVFIAAIWVSLSPIVLVVIRHGPRWREEKRLNDERKKEERMFAQQTATGNEDGTSGRTNKKG